MMIPFLEVKATYLELKHELDQAYQRVMDSGWYILGEEVALFEKEYADFCQASYCVAVANGPRRSSPDFSRIWYWARR